MKYFDKVLKLANALQNYCNFDSIESLEFAKNVVQEDEKLAKELREAKFAD